MKIAKSLLTSCSLIILLSFISSPADASVTHTPNDGDPTSFTQQLQSYLSDLDVKVLNGKKTVLVDFMVTPKGEIIVLSTNNQYLDSDLKRRLNYKKVYNHKLKNNTTYTLPLIFEMK